jgi:hypothetical protein
MSNLPSYPTHLVLKRFYHVQFAKLPYILPLPKTRYLPYRRRTTTWSQLPALLTHTKVYLLSYPILRSRRALEAAHSRGPVTTVLPLTVSL